MKLYTEIIDNESECEKWLVTEIKKHTEFKTVTLNPADLMGNYNTPLAAVLNDEINMDSESPSAFISIVIKSMGSNLQANQALTRIILDIIDKNQTLGDKAVLAQVQKTVNDIDATTGSTAAVKSVFTRIVLEVLL